MKKIILIISVLVGCLLGGQAYALVINPQVCPRIGQLPDSDCDGVADIFDRDSGSYAGVVVNPDEEEPATPAEETPAPSEETPTPPQTSDMDGDGVKDNRDNCDYDYNPPQRDSDGDGIGDACDNCPFFASSDQTDSDDDGFGDACQTDSDGDGIEDNEDNCPAIPNPDQADKDRDKRGDVCDTDFNVTEPPVTPQPKGNYPSVDGGCSLLAEAPHCVNGTLAFLAWTLAIAGLVAARKKSFR